MQLSVDNQAQIFLYTVLGGALIAFIYDIFRIKRKAIRTGKLMTYLEDFLYWIIVALVMFGVVYYSNDGEIRGYLFIGTLIGAVLYILLLSKIVVGSSMLVIRFLTRVVKTIGFVITYPIRLLLKLLSIPARIAGRAARKSARKVKSYGRVRIGRVVIWGRLIRNIRKKI